MGSIGSAVSGVTSRITSGVGSTAAGMMGNNSSAFSPIIGGAGSFTQQTGQAFTPQNTYQAGRAPITQQNFQPGLQSSQQAFNQNYANQQTLAQQLAAQGMGAGPNPAQAMLNQATQANQQQAAGLIASQRGLNPALAQRMALQEQGQIGQQAAGQSAVMNAQQQLAAQNAAAGLYGQIGSQQLSNYGTMQNAQAAQNNALIGRESNINNVNAGIAGQNTQNNVNTTGGILNGVGSAAGIFAHGGMVPRYADGGSVQPNWGYQMAPQMDAGNPQSYAAQFLSYKNPFDSKDGPMGKAGGAGGAGGGALSQAGPALAMAAARGGAIPGKAQVKGNSPKNDTVPAMLSPGEIVIPRSIVNSKNAPEHAAKFVAAVLAKKGRLRK